MNMDYDYDIDWYPLKAGGRERRHPDHISQNMKLPGCHNALATGPPQESTKHKAQSTKNKEQSTKNKEREARGRI